MKILFLISAIGAVYGGTSKVVLELAEVMGKQGIDINIVTTNANGETVLEVPLYTLVKQDHYRIIYFPCIQWGDYKYSRTLANWLFKHISEYDLVHTHAIFSLPNWSAYQACKSNNIPYIITPHGMLEPWALSYKAWKKKIYFSWIEKPALQDACTLHLISSIEKQHIHALGLKTPTIVLPNGLHPEEFIDLPDPELFYQSYPHTRNKLLLLFLGRIDPKKGLDLLANAFGKLHVHFPETHLIVAGPDNVGFLKTAQQYFIDAGCFQAVTFTGMLEGQLKLSALAAADLYVAPSYSEGFSMSILEGMAAGLPCVITTGCNFPEAGAANVAKVININADDFTIALFELVKDLKSAQAMGDRARQFVLENYTWESIGKKMINAYENILSHRSTSTG